MSLVDDTPGARVWQGEGWELREGRWQDSPPEVVDHVISDPPYEDEAHTLQRRAALGAGLRVETLPFAAITGEARRDTAAAIGAVCRRWALLFCQVEATQRWVEPLVAAGMSYRRTMIWIKPDGMPQYSGDRPGMGYESIVACHAAGASRWNGGGRHGVFVCPKADGWTNGAPHPTTKPRALMRQLVSLFTDPNELIWDPYAGSGTTGVACLQLGRRFLGHELQAHYAEVAAERLTAAQRGQTLRQYRAGQEVLDL